MVPIGDPLLYSNSIPYFSVFRNYSVRNYTPFISVLVHVFMGHSVTR